MAFNVTGGTTITDVRDGISPPVVTLSNENHTFVADSDGEIPGGDLTSFSTSVSVFVGQTRYSPTTSTTPTGTTYRIVSVTPPSAADLTPNINNTNGTITLADANTVTTGFVDTGSASITLNVSVLVAGVTGNLARTITLSKSRGGSAPITRATANTLTVAYDETGSTIQRTDDIQIDATFINNDAGTIEYASRAGGTGQFVAITAGTGRTFSNPTNANIDQRLTLTPAAFNDLIGSNDSITFRITRSDRFDQVTLSKLREGAGAVSVVITYTSGSEILRSDTDVAVIRADVLRGGTLIPNQPENDWTYAWSKDGTALTSANQAAMTGAVQQAGEGHNQRSLRIEGDGITDNTAARFSCNVIDPA